jgi:hypothetical protein
MLAFVVGGALAPAHRGRPLLLSGLAAQTAQRAAEPWTRAQTVEPGDFINELNSSTPAARPIVVYVGFPALYRGGHVPGASLHGPTSSPEGLADLKRWAQGVARSSNVVLYCGCCPLGVCPNVRPAFTALRDLGFDHVRVLLLPSNFATDWADKGYPVER